MLSRCYNAEMSKLLKSKGIWVVLALIILVAIMVFALSMAYDVPIGDSSNELMQILKNMQDFINDPDRNVDNIGYGDFANRVEEELNRVSNDNNTFISRFSDEVGSKKRLVAILRYLDAHEDVKLSEIAIMSSSMMSLSDNAYNFTATSLSLILEVIIFYAVISMSGLLAGEKANGTLKMELLRPNSRNSIFTSKLLSTFTVSGVLFLIGTLVTCIFSMIEFPMGTKRVLSVVGTNGVFLMNEFLFLFLEIIFALFTIFVVISFSSFVASITKYNRAAALAIPVLVIMLGNMTAMLLQVAYIGMVDFNYNLDLMSFLAPDAMLFRGSSLYTAIPILLCYLAIFLSVSYVKFNRLEV